MKRPGFEPGSYKDSNLFEHSDVPEYPKLSTPFERGVCQFHHLFILKYIAGLLV